MTADAQKRLPLGTMPKTHITSHHRWTVGEKLEKTKQIDVLSHMGYEVAISHDKGYAMLTAVHPDDETGYFALLRYAGHRMMSGQAALNALLSLAAIDHLERAI